VTAAHKPKLNPVVSAMFTAALRDAREALLRAVRLGDELLAQAEPGDDLHSDLGEHLGQLEEAADEALDCSHFIALETT
jgi:hypothetical protein